MHLIHGLAEGNARTAEILYRERYPQKDAFRPPDVYKFAPHSSVFFENDMSVMVCLNVLKYDEHYSEILLRQQPRLLCWYSDSFKQCIYGMPEVRVTRNPPLQCLLLCKDPYSHKL
ncbi:hypothetical protein TNCV_1637521 [Trichonephila clavipes]|nr:hypothetical protein TNCV_1637521 [Trichonephila clavipes]